MKNVLIVSQVIPQWYVDTLAKALGENVHIDIITGSAVEANVIPSPRHDSRSLKSRLICWIRHYRFMNKWMRENRDRHYDLIFSVSNPPINSWIGLKLKKQFHAPFVYMNWDLYPQVIENSLKNQVAELACGMWHWWNHINYPRIDKILTIGSVMAESMTANISRSVSVGIIPIAVDTDRLRPIEKKDNMFCRQHGLTEKFVILYSGKMGIGHNIELILKAAEKLKDYSDIQFVFIGEGQKYGVIESFIKESDSKNILLFPFQPDSVFPQSISCGDVGIISQEESLAHLFMPSKTYSMMACGEAIIGICTEKDDLHNLIVNTQIGEVITDGSANTLAENILMLYHNREKLKKYQRNSRNIAEQQFSQNIIIAEYREMFEKFIELE